MYKTTLCGWNAFYCWSLLQLHATDGICFTQNQKQNITETLLCNDISCWHTSVSFAPESSRVERSVNASGLLVHNRSKAVITNQGDLISVWIRLFDWCKCTRAIDTWRSFSTRQESFCNIKCQIFITITFQRCLPSFIGLYLKSDVLVLLLRCWGEDET